MSFGETKYDIIIRQMRYCSQIMEDTARELASFSEFTEHAKQLNGASGIMQTWIEGAMELAEKETKKRAKK